MFRPTGVLLVLLLTYQLVAHAEVVPGTTQEEGPNRVDSHYERTLFHIIRGCVSTTIICAWVTIHPNIPPREGPFKKTLRRLGLMFWTIVAPEILPCWALNQLLAAVTVRDVYNDGKGYKRERRGIWKRLKELFSLQEIKGVASPAWTVTHGHFLIMGGFHIVEPPIQSTGNSMGMHEPAVFGLPSTSARLFEETQTDTERELGQGPSENGSEGRVTILTLEMLRELVKDRDFEIQMTKEEITDRSKGPDGLSKVIFILQTTWFIFQCIERRVQGLDLTQLELTTLALASLNGITFGLWWDKPLRVGAQARVRLYLKRGRERINTQVPSSHCALSRECKDRPVILEMQKLFADCVTVMRDDILCRSQGTMVVRLVRLPLVIPVLLLSPIITSILALIGTVSNLVQGSSSFPSDDTHVPTFYVPKHRFPERSHILLLITLGAVFGGIHCSAWNFSFPTHAERTLWCVASLAVTILPITIFPFGLIITSTRRFPNLTPFIALPTALALFVCAFAYVSARLLLLGLAFSLLRDNASTVFTPTSWTKFYPHFL